MDGETSSGGSASIRTEGLTKYYGRHLGVEDVTFDVSGGEVVGFLGPNGSGKTTVLRMLVGLISITRGRAALFGGIALVGACWTGRRGVGLGAGLGCAITAFVLYSLAPLVSAFDALLPANPFQWTVGQSPLVRGVNGWYVTLALVSIAALSAAAAVGYAHRDMRV